MASGLLLVLSGENIFKKEKYLKLSKEYRFEILFGFSTDTQDILGKVMNSSKDTYLNLELSKKIKSNLKFFRGNFIQKYPIYSSKTVHGKQLFQYARDGERVEIPEKEVKVYSIKFFKLRKINNLTLLNNIQTRVGRVVGDFRQKEILKLWRKHLLLIPKRSFWIGSFRIKCSSGTYVRSIANDLGDKIGIPALAFSIKRTKIGVWELLKNNIKN
jgi:tRNA pseudouridine55 synthase